MGIVKVRALFCNKKALLEEVDFTVKSLRNTSISFNAVTVVSYYQPKEVKSFVRYIKPYRLFSFALSCEQFLGST